MAVSISQLSFGVSNFQFFKATGSLAYFSFAGPANRLTRYQRRRSTPGGDNAGMVDVVSLIVRQALQLQAASVSLVLSVLSSEAPYRRGERQLVLVW